MCLLQRVRHTSSRCEPSSMSWYEFPLIQSLPCDLQPRDIYKFAAHYFKELHQKSSMQTQPELPAKAIANMQAILLRMLLCKFYTAIHKSSAPRLYAVFCRALSWWGPRECWCTAQEQRSKSTASRRPQFVQKVNYYTKVVLYHCWRQIVNTLHSCT